MELREKIQEIIRERGCTQKEFAESLGLNHISFNRNMKNNNITSDVIKALITKLTDIDYNWLFKQEESATLELNEPSEIYESKSINKINQALKILEELKKDLSQ